MHVTPHEGGGGGKPEALPKAVPTCSEKRVPAPFLLLSYT